MSVLAQCIPYASDASGERRVRAILDTLNTWAPNLESCVLHHDFRSPADFEDSLGLPGGSFHHGEMALDQMFFMRPIPGWAGYETPLDGLFLAGPGCHPGGGMTGLPGANAARQILSRRR